MKRSAHFRARLHPRTTLAKLRKSWNGSCEVPVVQGLRGNTKEAVLAVTAAAGRLALSIWHLALSNHAEEYEGFSRFASLGRGSPVDTQDLSGNEAFPAGRTLWAHHSDASVHCVYRCQHCRRLRETR